MSEQLLTRVEVERRTGFKRSALYERIAAGTFPTPRTDPDGGRSVRWLASDVDAWIARWVGSVAGSESPGTRKAA